MIIGRRCLALLIFAICAGLVSIAPTTQTRIEPGAQELFERGFRAHEIEDCAEALELYGKATDQGNTTARPNLSVLYAYLQDIPKDLLRAIIYYDYTIS
jgi:TPR repeat protein